ncbi:hypothetical protein CK240_16695 [Paracoccus salipaludis]|uniref:Uncharacterized protein n=1 Tax=Paracoccus salipaludis TaxID=2032623 RepID=A0A2A2GBV9_9RHOB|nr:hypothetical protein CK240_16695 [Paracoccus salipaludis]
MFIFILVAHAFSYAPLGHEPADILQHFIKFLGLECRIGEVSEHLLTLEQDLQRVAVARHLSSPASATA